jgi:hypothetical protein
MARPALTSASTPRRSAQAVDTETAEKDEKNEGK